MRCVFLLIMLCGLAIAEDGLKAWLRYAPPPMSRSLNEYPIPSRIVVLNSTMSSPVFTASQEVVQGIQSMFGISLDVDDAESIQSRIDTSKWHGNLQENPFEQFPLRLPKADTTQIWPAIIGTIDVFEERYPGKLPDLTGLQPDGFYINISSSAILILGRNERGALYGSFKYLSDLAQGTAFPTTHMSNPDVPIRWVNQWDNLHGRGRQGSIERGYAGASIFFENGLVRDNLDRARQYARLLASIGINAVVVNNVNADSGILSDRNIEGLARIADAFRPYGIQLGISCYFASPEKYGLPTADPLDEDVIAWWNNITNVIYERIPDMAGYLVKANSEGQPGPLTYNRTLADGANMFARALRPHGGTVMFRAFIYDASKLNLKANWRDDRAVQAAQFFDGLDGMVDDNVVIQIKNGPIDFQVREPVSSLFSHIRRARTALEIQVTQEYLGQQCHIVYLGSMYKEIMDFDFAVDNTSAPLSKILNGQQFDRKAGGYAAVVNAGLDETWLGSHLAMSNLYAYGHLAWNPSRDPEELVRDWTRLTFGHDEKIVETIFDMSMTSWPAFENYTANLGLLSMVDAATHFGPDPGYRVHSAIATRAYKGSIGIDRTVDNGSGYAGQYPKRIADMYENVDATPDELLLFFHHVPYTRRLHSGSTVIQRIYDAHYAGSQTVHDYIGKWKSIKQMVDVEQYENVLSRLKFQAGHALVWRDAINNYFHDLTRIPDEKGRVGNHPWRIEAEDMDLDGYVIHEVRPAVSASGGRGIVTSSTTKMGIAAATIGFPAGEYALAINYFDVATGCSAWQVFLNDQPTAQWAGDGEFKLGHSPSRSINGASATRITFSNITVAPGDVLRIEGTPDGQEMAPLDYISFLPLGIVD
ncbi:hypothetical protein S7711_01311 [Stachybotrys chartarum IBT 7711]|uniref:Alpha-glucuronidase n=1 Tax=Stachybotrys chartarum (strain CBS 109288 / IBT 7711) TaxID=1280523 RepID=A0A084BBN3_STACB|nr:hypothetical protein S7711_01311 [Stachybotrys chartarum IBT 7711]